MTNFLKNKAIYDATLLAYRGGVKCIDESKGNMTSDSLFAVASISKLYTHALIFQLIDVGALSYGTKLTDVLSRDLTERLPQVEDVTIRHLVDQNTGFPNYEMDRQPNGKVLMNEIFQHDRRVEFEEVLEIVSRLAPKSKLGGQKAYYADINAMLLGKIAEVVTGKSAKQLLADHICRPLGLVRTHWSDGREKIVPIYNGVHIVVCQEYLSSQVYQGGIIATNSELMRFTRAFFGGKLFSPSHIAHPIFRTIQFRPIKYGSGMMQLTIASLVAYFLGGVREIRGHSGITGSFAFYCSQKDVFVTGTVNQLKYKPYATIFRSIAACDKNRKSNDEN
ncbi:serine hydrolase domain-containing protein [Neisseria wadsworthii]|uniref:serine hydrolase domain-containing protein n=1 Tax=Neisseria wadsworthii TaxID=607711 RepID=UPI000D2FE298|nr:serine hydrolase domain-containing protein [Neisseria wadsworthii]